MRRRGFTLVELLIVIGVIALLAGLLLSSGRKARDQANRVGCAANLHSIGAAMLMYAQDNDGHFPAHANVGVFKKEDWIYWDGAAGHEVEKSPIMKYLRGDAAKVLRCPSDDLDDRLRSIGPPYRYTYTINLFFSCDGPTDPQLRLSAIVQPGQKMMMIEEDEISLDDGNWHPTLLQQPIENFLGTRHIIRRKDWQSWYTKPLLQRPDRGDRGNVAFADGHVDYVTRADTWQPMFYDPRSNAGRDPTR